MKVEIIAPRIGDHPGKRGNFYDIGIVGISHR